MKRIYSIDFTRGLVMIIMALDHTRDLLHVNALDQSPTNLTSTTPALFFTRWITHLCAPIFVFLAGTSAYLASRNNNRPASNNKFLLTRGLWLLLLECTVVNLGLFFDPGFHTLMFEVIAAIGFGFITLSFLLKLPVKTIGIIGLVILFGHDLFSLIPTAQGSLTMKILSPLFGLTVFPLFSNHVFVVAYPPIPWLGILLTGFAAGNLFERSITERKKIFIRLGATALLVFVLLRFSNVYGDPAIWSSQKNGLYTFLSFMNVSKYPPSLLFCLLTLGSMFLILAFAEQFQNRATDIAFTYGKSPLFYFVIHLYILHIVLIMLLFAQGIHWQDMDFASRSFGRPKGIKTGIPLWAVYVVWTLVVAALYKPCAWFGRYKQAHQYWWLRYL